MAATAPIDAITLRKKALLLESHLNRVTLEGDLILLRDDLTRLARPASVLSRGAAITSMLAPLAGGLFTSRFMSGPAWLGRIGTAVRLGAAAAGLFAWFKRRPRKD